MSNKSISEHNPVTSTLNAVSDLVRILQGLSPDEQKRAISAAMILLSNEAPIRPTSVPVPTDSGIPPKAALWLQKNTITKEQLDQVFFLDSEHIDVIAHSLPGRGKRQQTIYAYLLAGLRSFLGTGEPNFSDGEAREICTRIGCYDSPNHSAYLREFGNLIVGTKDSGWKLTNPGMNAGAQLIKQMTEAAA